MAEKEAKKTPHGLGSDYEVEPPIRWWQRQFQRGLSWFKQLKQEKTMSGKPPETPPSEHKGEGKGEDIPVLDDDEARQQVKRLLQSVQDSLNAAKRRPN